MLARHRDRFEVVGLAAGGANLGALAGQVAACGAHAVAVADPDAGADLLLALRALGVRPEPVILAGSGAAVQLVDSTPADVVLNAVTGSRGLAPTLAALASGATLALANKESLVAGGALVTAAARPGQIVPVDSEHSALAQCLRAGRAGEVAALVLTASGGPFRGLRREDLADVTVAQTLAHPTWSMGPVVTVNSATLVNKGLELIEAHMLFGVPYDRIEVVVHPQSVVHSMVTFTDGSTIAQASPPDMRLPIALALAWPDRLPEVAAPCGFTAPTAWTFEPLDEHAFPAVHLARQAGTAGGCLPAVYNAANEEAVAAFLGGHVAFPSIVDTVRWVLDGATAWLDPPADVAGVLAAETWARQQARRHLAGSVQS